MAPKPKTKAAKARAKAAKVALKAAAAAAANGGAEGEVIEGGVLAIPAGKPKNDSAKKRIMMEVDAKSFDEVQQEYKAKKRQAEAGLAESAAMENANQKQVDEAKAEYDAAKAEIEAKSREELEAAALYRSLVAKKGEFASQVNEKRAELHEAQKKIAFLEVLQVNHAKTKSLEDIRRKAQEQAVAAKEMYQQQKLKEKEALEATRAALAATRAEIKNNLGRGAKRTSDGVTKDGAPDDLAETQPATQAADID